MSAQRRRRRDDTRTPEAATYLQPLTYLREITHLGGPPRRVGPKLHGDHHTCTLRRWDPLPLPPSDSIWRRPPGHPAPPAAPPLRPPARGQNKLQSLA